MTTNTMELALRDTVLSPRFYTTDFNALDRVDVGPVRAEWDELIAEMTRDPNKTHFKRTEPFDDRLENLPDGLRQEFVDFLVSSLTSEFSAACSMPRSQSGRKIPIWRPCFICWRAMSPVMPASSMKP